MLKNKNWLFSFYFTASPGILKACIFTMLYWTLSSAKYADFVVYYSNAIIVGLVGGVGVGTIIIRNQKKTSEAIKMIILSFVISAPVFLYFIFVKNDFALEFMIVSIGVLLNQIFRFYIISNSNLCYGGKIELLNFLLIMPLLFMFPEDPEWSIFFAYSSNALLLFYLTEESEKIKSTRYISDLTSSSVIGYTSLISSGIVFFLPQVAHDWGNENLLSTLGIVLGVVGILSIIPRSILNSKLRKINEALSSKNISEFNLECVFVKKVTNRVIIPSIIVLIFYVLIQARNIDLGLIFFLSSMSVFIYVGQYSLVESNAVNFIGLEKLSLITNIIIFSLFLLLSKVVPSLVHDSYVGMSCLCISCAIFYYIRMRFFNRKIGRYIS